MSLREEQCKKVCRILDNVLANRPTERDSLIVAVRKAFAEPKRGKWIEIEAFDDSRYVKCDQCKTVQVFYYGKRNTNFCPNCGADMRGKQDG